MAKTRVVDNRTFLLGLDNLYRELMKRHEREELLTCARRVAETLEVTPADVPVEGYYTEDKLLTEYFLWMRALQNVPKRRAPSVNGMREFQRLLGVASAPIYGIPLYEDTLLPLCRDSLAHALLLKAEWTVEQLTATAESCARDSNDFSLVGLASRIRDAVVLAATRESVVLYALFEVGSAWIRLPPPKFVYVWKVDPDLAEQARKFIEVFNALFAEALPAPEPEEAETYWEAGHSNHIVGRCVRIGREPDGVPAPRNYHWAIYRKDSETLAVDEFWHPDLWTTERYRACLPAIGIPQSRR